jgi:hypothetical protein
VALALGGVAVVGLAAGTYFGLDAFSKHSDSNALCPTANACTPAGLSANEQSKTSADRATVLFGVSIAALGAAAYLWFSGAPAPASSAIQVTPLVGSQGGGAAVSGTF